MKWGGIILAAFTALLWSRPTQAYTYGSTLNPPITSTVNVQIIDVCGSGASAAVCAPTSGVASYETFANAIYNQAGIAFAFNPTIETIHVAGNAGCANGAASTFCADTTTASLFDTAHTLVDTPGNGQSTVANTLNLYLVNGLVVTNNGVATTTASYGWGLIGGNGALVMTGTNPTTKKTAALDTMAHELGHNLGLAHVDKPPLTGPLSVYDTTYNLMNTGSRTVPTTLCQVTPYTCAVAPGATVPQGRDQLAPFQVSAVQNPLLLNQLPGVAVQVPGQVVSLGPQPGCTTSDSGCATTTFYTVPNSTAAVSAVKFRFLDGSVSVNGFSAYTLDKFDDLIPLTVTATITETLIGSHVEWDVVPSTPLAAGDYFDISYTYPLIGHNPLGAGLVYDYSPPFSTEFDFTDGTTSRAGYDTTGATPGFFSDQGQVFGFDPTAPGVVQGPSVLPSTSPPAGANCTLGPSSGYGCWEDIDTFGQDPRIIAAVQPPLSFPSGVPTPEPGDVVLLLSGLLGLAAVRRPSLRRLAGCTGC